MKTWLIKHIGKITGMAGLFSLKISLSILICINCFQVFSQDIPPSEVDKLEKIAEGVNENTDFSELIDNRLFFKDHPINLNHTNKEELAQLGMLNDIAIANLLQHIDDNGPLLRLEELQSIDGFDLAKIREIQPYIRIDDNPLPTGAAFFKMVREGKHQVILRVEQTVEKKKGFTAADSLSALNVNSRYLGSPQKIYARYRFTYGRYLSWGITGEKDAGEEFFKGSQKNGFDFYSAHFFIRNIGPVKALAIGDFNLSYGQGLTLWTGLAYGKGSDVSAIKRNPGGIAPYSSVTENSFRRGAAVSLGNRNFTFDVFYSSTRFDANQGDTSQFDEVLVTSIQTSGYHRTQAELSDKNALHETMIGAHLSYDSRNLKLGVTAYQSHLGTDLLRTPSLYNQYQFSGTDFQNIGFDYSYVFRNLNFFGEIAHNKNGALATVNGLIISLDPRISMMLLHRNYERAYYSILSNPFRESDVANERGFYSGISIKPVRTVTLDGYYDFFTFPWLRYQVDAPSHGYEYLAQLTYAPSKRTELYFRIKEWQKQRNTYAGDTPLDYLVDVKQVNYRFNATYKVSAAFSLRSRVEFSHYAVKDAPADEGYVILQDVNCNPMGFPLSFNFRYAIFDTRTYDSRIYTFEDDLPGTFTVPAYYYQGQRIYFMVQYHIRKGIDVWARVGQTVYTNQDVISSGLDEIDGPKKTDVRFQLRLEF